MPAPPSPEDVVVAFSPPSVVSVLPEARSLDIRASSVASVLPDAHALDMEFEVPNEKSVMVATVSTADTIIRAVESALEAIMREWHGKFQKEVQEEIDRLFCRLTVAHGTALTLHHSSSMGGSTMPLPQMPALQSQQHRKKGRGAKHCSTTSLSSTAPPESAPPPESEQVQCPQKPPCTIPEQSGKDIATVGSNREGSQISGAEEVSFAGRHVTRKKESEVSVEGVTLPKGVSFLGQDKEEVTIMADDCDACSFQCSTSSVGAQQSVGLNSVLISKHFEYFVSMVIFINCATMGLQAHSAVECIERDADMLLTLAPQKPRYCDITAACMIWAEHAFTAVFALENIIRFKVQGYKAFVPTTGDGVTNLFDALLVLVTGIIANWVLPLLEYLSIWKLEGDVIKILTVFRAFRLVRLLKVVRKVPMFREAWRLIRGLKDSSRTLIWTIVVIFLVTYAWAILGLVTIVQDLLSSEELRLQPDLQTTAVLLEYFQGIDNLMFTLIQVLCQDSFHALIREVQVYVWYAWIYFYAYVAVCCLVLMNLVTAIIVENALSVSHQDHDLAVIELERQNERNLRSLQALFELMDEDGNGTLSWEEFQKSFEDESMRSKWMLLDFHPRDCKELFQLLDDGDGEIETEEFFEALLKMKGPAQSKDVYRLLKRLSKLQNALVSIHTGQASEGFRSILSSSATHLY